MKSWLGCPNDENRKGAWQFILMELITFCMKNKINLMEPGARLADMPGGLLEFLESLHEETA